VADRPHDRHGRGSRRPVVKARVTKLTYAVARLAATRRGIRAALAHRFSKAGSAIIGKNPAHPDFVIAANGGSDLVYVPSGNRQLAERAVAALLKQDYVSGLFVDDRFGHVPGISPLSAIGLHGNAVTPVPSIVVNFRSYTSGCAIPTNCTVEIADTPLQ
jgi:hypothetical protein